MKQMLNSNMIATEIKEEKLSPSGLILDSPSLVKTTKKAVVKYPDCKGVTNVGDVVHMPFHSGVEMNYEGEDVLLINVDRDILFID